MITFARLLFCLAVAGLIFGAAAVSAEVQISPQAHSPASLSAPNMSAPSMSSPALVVDETVTLQCWQGGGLVFEEAGLTEASVVPLLPATAQAAASGNIGLKARDASGAQVTLVPLGDGLCLIRGLANGS